MKMKNHNRIRGFLSLALVLCILIASGCSSSSDDSGIKTLKIGTEDITGSFNPLFAETEGDKAVASQIFSSVQSMNGSNKLVNNAGNISYEYDNDKVKYTVTIQDDLYFSDGTNVTIDDVIFWYYVIADASYTGPYSDFYLNDIEGLKEYYYDDEDYETGLARCNGNDKLISNYIKDNYSSGKHVTEISGIKRVDNYTCTILFDSRNINSISEINAYLISKAYYSQNYTKGSADKIAETADATMGCGLYYLSSFSDGEAKLVLNTYNKSDTPAFGDLRFIDLAEKGKDPAESVKSGYVDIISTEADASVMSVLSADNIKYSLTSEAAYCSIFYNTKTIELTARQMLMGVCNIYQTLESETGNYYTKVYMPMSVRYEESPQMTEAFYQGSDKASTLGTYFTSLNAYCIGTQEDLPYKILSAYSEELGACGVSLNINAVDEDAFVKAVSSGKADLWIMDVPDGNTSDKYEYYNSEGSLNYTGLSDSEIDTLTEKIRSATGFTDRTKLTEQLLNKVMYQAVELPLYQRQIVTAYNTDTIDSDCLGSIAAYDGYAGIIGSLI